jgi:hypothetical protein
MRRKGMWVLFVVSALGAIGGLLSLAALAGVNLASVRAAVILPAVVLTLAQEAMASRRNHEVCLMTRLTAPRFSTCSA